MNDEALVEDILSFWFGEDAERPDKDRMAMWWGGGPAIDDEIRARFGPAVERALSGELEDWAASPRSCLALVLLLDQFTRNLGRGTAAAFAGDAGALEASLAAVDRGLDRELRPIERAFLYMPMMHAEDRAMAGRSIEAFERLAQEVGEGQPDFARHARQHAEIVRRFGRYPHRNALLGRADTPEEIAFLAGGGPDFGQRKKR